MLGKLIKHEFKSTGRILSIILIALMVITPITAFYLKLRTSNMFSQENILLDIFEIVCVLLYVCAMIAAGAATVIVLLTRFYQSMVTKESYLTHTLPVKTSSLIISKTLVACAWQIISVIVMICSILLFAYILGGWSLSDINWDIIKQAFEESGFSSSNLILLIILLLVSMIVAYLKAYVSFAFGHLFNNHPFAGFILVYIIITFVVNIISSISSFVFSAALEINMYDEISVAQAMDSIFILSLVLNVILGIACYIGTVLVFKKKLNI